MLGWTDTRTLAEVLPAKEARAISKAFGYITCGELLEHYPRDHSRHGSGVNVETARDGDIVTCVGEVIGAETFTARGKQIHKITISDGRSRLGATFFNARYASRVLRRGTRAMFSGKLSHYQGTAQIQHPDFFLLEKAKKTAATGSLRSLAAYGDLDEILAELEYLPVYPATGAVSSWRIMGAIRHILRTLPPITEPLPEVPTGLPDLDTAIRGVHFPGPEGPDSHLARLKYNEALSLALVMALRRVDTQARQAPALHPAPGGHHDTLRQRLPYPLTGGQQQVLAEIDTDLRRNFPMSRLLQGEVGSGKTVVSLLAMLRAIDAGHQCALLAPTEVLAVQHARSLTELLTQAGLPITVVPLTGSMPVATRRHNLLDIISGQADIVVGTHALIQDTVEFFDLGLVVVDEQHRFGVEQRDRLRAKGRDEHTPHLLVMTATPIPRTIAMTVFADLAVSTLRELPGGRKPIQSAIVPDYRPTWTTRALERIREEVAAGHQAYIVCPRIDGDGGVLDIAEHLRTGPFHDLTVDILHGRLHSEDKDTVMADFARGGIDVLVATTVIEVGVDVPNATVMLIREAENFGVSQLHQLRGRVGRGGHASLCLFHTLTEPGHPAHHRVAGVAATADGFRLAELDLANRQEGDILGTRQSGTERTVRLLNLLTDHPTIERANTDATGIVAHDPRLAQRLSADIARDDREYLEKS